jgi:hypothetical protein
MINPLRRWEMNTQDVLVMEAQLQAVLKPVTIRPAFMAQMKERLMTQPVIEPPAAIIKRYAPVVAAGMLGSALIVIAGVRALITLLGALGVLRSMRNRLPHQEETTRPAIAPG